MTTLTHIGIVAAVIWASVATAAILWDGLHLLRRLVKSRRGVA